MYSGGGAAPARSQLSMRLARLCARRLGEDRRAEPLKVRREVSTAGTETVANAFAVEGFAATQAVPGRCLDRLPDRLRGKLQGVCPASFIAASSVTSSASQWRMSRASASVCSRRWILARNRSSSILRTKRVHWPRHGSGVSRLSKVMLSHD